MNRKESAQTRTKCASDELLISASAMCLTPASPMWFPGRGDGAMSICANGNGNEARGRRTTEVQLRQRRVAHQRIGDVLDPIRIDAAN